MDLKLESTLDSVDIACINLIECSPRSIGPTTRNTPPIFQMEEVAISTSSGIMAVYVVNETSISLRRHDT